MSQRLRWVLASVAILLWAVGFTSCAKKQTVKTPTGLALKPDQLIFQVNRLAAEGKYTEAVTTCSDFILMNPKVRSLDRVLFHCGLLLTAEQNPAKDYHQAAATLSRISVEFPTSDYGLSAQVVIRVMETLTELRSLHAQLSKTMTAQGETIKHLQEELDRTSKRAQRLLESLEQLQRVRAQQTKTIDEQASAIRELQSELDKIKRIDLKKRP